jgi:hypothetical protein
LPGCETLVCGELALGVFRAKARVFRATRIPPHPAFFELHPFAEDPSDVRADHVLRVLDLGVVGLKPLNLGSKEPSSILSVVDAQDPLKEHDEVHWMMSFRIRQAIRPVCADMRRAPPRMPMTIEWAGVPMAAMRHATET